jgi:hypothetical protein
MLNKIHTLHSFGLFYQVYNLFVSIMFIYIHHIQVVLHCICTKCISYTMNHRIWLNIFTDVEHSKSVGYACTRNFKQRLSYPLWYLETLLVNIVTKTNNLFSTHFLIVVGHVRHMIDWLLWVTCVIWLIDCCGSRASYDWLIVVVHVRHMIDWLLFNVKRTHYVSYIYEENKFTNHRLCR